MKTPIPVGDLLHLDSQLAQSHHLINESGVPDLRSESDGENWVERLLREWAEQPYSLEDGVAEISITGTLMKRGHALLAAWTGHLHGYDQIRYAVQKAQEDTNVKSILLTMDTPGGMAVGADETARDIRNCTKKVVAYVDGVCASAGYQLASGADQIIAPKMAIVGSIGTIVRHFDYSKMLEKEGIVVTEIKSSPKKGGPSPYRPLDEEDKKHLESMVRVMTEAFVSDISVGRGMAEESVWTLATGEWWFGNDAKAKGLVDLVGFREDAIEAARAA